MVLETAGPGTKDLESAEFNVFNMVFCSFRHFAGSFLYEAQAWGNTPLKPLLNKGKNSQIQLVALEFPRLTSESIIN